MNDAKTTRDYFDRTATRFTANYRTNGSFAERKRVWDRCIDESIVCLDDGGLCLDVGCGDGSLSRRVAAQGHKTVGIDQSTSMLSLARRRASEAGISANVQYVEATLPLPPALVAKFENKAGLILCSSVLEYVGDYASVLRQFDTMLRNDGRLIVSIPNRHSIYRFAERIVRRVFPTRGSYLQHQRHQFHAGAFKEQIVASGYSLVHEEYFALPFHSVAARFFGKRRGRRVATLYLLAVEKRRGVTKLQRA